MPVRNASAEWQGTLKEGSGTMAAGSGAFNVPYTFSTRFENDPGTNPEELIGAALAGCFSMFLSSLLTNAGFKPASIRTSAIVHLEAGPTVTQIELNTEASVPGLSDAELQQHAEAAKKNCPISKALTGPEIKLHATLSH
jgi:lipoyl-dependent peroxiredoxin